MKVNPNLLLSISLCFLLFTTCKTEQLLSSKAVELPPTANYEKDWEKIERLEKDGLPKSILTELDQLLLKAEQQKNYPQIFKIFAYQSKYISKVEEGALANIFDKYEDRAREAASPLKQIMHSALAEMYLWYYQQNQWKFSERSHAIGSANESVLSMDLQSILKKIQLHYDSSLQKPNLLQQVDINYLHSILTDTAEQKNTVYDHSLRPTLFDLLAHRALDFYTSGEAKAANLINASGVKQGDFAHFKEFMQREAMQDDFLSTESRALKIHQDLLQFHWQQNNIQALVDVDLKRIAFVAAHYHQSDKKKLHLQALKELRNAVEKSSAVAEVDYEIANYYYSMGNEHSNAKGNSSYLQKAVTLCKEIMAAHPQTLAFGKARFLLQQIEEKQLSLQSLYAYPIKENILLNLNFKNLDIAYFKIYKSPFNFLEIKEDKLSEKINKLQKQKSLLQKTIQLNAAEDYLFHSTEISLPAMQRGRYILVASNKEDLQSDSAAVALVEIWVSDIAYLSKNIENGMEIRSFNRTSGEFLQEVKLEVWKQEYRPSSRSYHYVKYKNLKTDKEGFASLPSEEKYHNFQFLFINGDDSLFSSDNYQVYAQGRAQTKKRIMSHIFLDRAIYRPGQTVHFKSILIENEGDQKELLKNYSSSVKLYNANGKELSTLDLKTNSYGSMSGSFTLPSSGLKGQYRIADKYGSRYFSVEEYKRPKFKVELDSLSSEYKLNELVNISGKAESYSGSKISNASLSYRIYREAHFPFPYYSMIYLPHSPKTEIASGQIKTDKNGEFTFSFKAIPDYGIDSSLKPVFNYHIQVDVTDISGETQGNSKNLSIGYTAMLLKSNLADEVFKNSLQKLTILAENLSGSSLSTEIRLSIHQLQAPETLFKSRILDTVDVHSMDSLDFIEKHPHLAFGNEDQMHSWKKVEKVLDTSYTTTGKEFPLSASSSWESGAYYLEAVGKDKFGKEVVLKKYFVLLDPQDKKLPIPEYLKVHSNQKKFEVGDTAKILFGSSLKNFTLVYEFYGKDGLLSKQVLQLDQEQKLIKIPIMEEHRGGIKLHFSAVHDNRAFIENLLLEVPYSNKELSISLNTYRNKLQPASKEVWSMSIKNNKGEKVVGELLASMYDASLDKFQQEDWSLQLYPRQVQAVSWRSDRSFSTVASSLYAPEWNRYQQFPQRIYRDFNWFGFHLGYYTRYHREYMADDMMLQEGMILEKNASSSETREETEIAPTVEQTKRNYEIAGARGIRKNFEETAFFYPHIRVNKQGDYEFSFTLPDALTEWNFRALAHSSDLKIGHFEQSFVSQKDLMVFPNMPRFFRSGDQLQLASRIDNLSKSIKQGSVELLFFDPISKKEIKMISSDNQKQNFSLEKEESKLIKWEVNVPKDVGIVAYRIMAKTEDFSDGEENTIAVLPDRMLVTESMPLSIRGNESKKFSFTKLANSPTSSSMKHQLLSFEFSSNPAWYAVQALPYLMQAKEECSEQVFSSYFANSLASHIANSNPQIKDIFEYWKNLQPDALLSQLEKNQELKSILINESPWLQDAESESERKKRLGILFDLNRLGMEKENSLEKLQSMQLSNGGWPWFVNGADDRFISQHIVAGFGHLQKMGLEVMSDQEVRDMLERALDYLDERIGEDYAKLLENKQVDSIGSISELQLHYLYARSFFPDVAIKSENRVAFNFFLANSGKNWLERPLFSKAVLSMVQHRSKNTALSEKIIQSLIENSVQDEEMGMYWKSNTAGYFWYQSAIETQALLIEAFEEIKEDSPYIEEMKIWLLKQKQVQDWKSTKATALACYALLLRGDDLISEEKDVKITIGGKELDLKKETVEAGTGYVKKSWTEDEITNKMAEVEVQKNSSGIAWGALHWQYFEELDKITPSETALKLEKQLFIEEYTAAGPVIKPISEGNKLQVGDKLVVRIILQVDRRMEYVHMKDMRASGLEPLNVLSSHHYQDGLAYYQSTSDASTNFFFSNLPKGTYVFEYALRASVEGTFSNGISSIQSMYAPEFSSHSEGKELLIQAAP